MTRNSIIAVLLSVLVGCGDEPPTTIDVLVRVKPDDLAPAVLLRAGAFLNDIPAQKPFEFSDKPLDRFWVRMPASSGGGLLRLSIFAKDGGGCVVWRGGVETTVGPPYLQEITAELAAVTPPEC